MCLSPHDALTDLLIVTTDSTVVTNVCSIAFESMYAVFVLSLLQT